MNSSTKSTGQGDFSCAAESIVASCEEEALADRRFAGWKRRPVVTAA